ncbi:MULTISPECIES: hypothetical protein [Pontibacillus]|uniref:Spore germination protein n=1 Tax=Pontibacillus chungwhensis TaxID=265426 RepID=A0ABY8UXW4_9BACI|nr:MULTISPECIES: hypothetical protein [Pontibacillus]MCD5325724.1 hypothetical protein [Pontibacillus sp. HN14]WIF98038.1 hypothetical protein QNI29_20305 [Pontibacillus chungwhensis]
MKDLHIEHFSVENITHSSGIFSGTNVQSSFSSSTHINEGNGAITGERNQMAHNHHVIISRPNDQDDQ